MDRAAPLRSRERLPSSRLRMSRRWHAWALLLLVACIVPNQFAEARAQKRLPVPAFWPPIDDVWRLDLGGEPIGPPAFDEKAAYIALGDGRLFAVALANGRQLWWTTRGLTAPPAVLGSYLVGIIGDSVVALDPTNGRPRWRQPLGATSVMTPAINAKWIAAVTTRPELILFRPADGSVAWRLTLPAPARTIPVGNADFVFVGLTNGAVIGVSVKTGAIQWTHALGSEPLRLSTADDQLFVGTANDFLYSLATRSGRRHWRWRTGGDVSGSVSLDAKRVYAVSMDNSIVALGRGGGDLKWEQRLPSRPVGGSSLVGDTLLLATVASELKLFAAVRGTLLDTIALPGCPIHPPHVVGWDGPTPPRAIMLTGGGLLIAVGPRVEPEVQRLDPMPGTLLPPEVLASIEPPLVPMLFPPGRLLAPETLPPRPVRKPPAR